MQTDDFTVPFLQGDSEQIVNVHIVPSTDDIDTYACHLNGERLTQIRKDSGQWKQLWGELDDREIKQLGEQIDQALVK